MLLPQLVLVVLSQLVLGYLQDTKSYHPRYNTVFEYHILEVLPVYNHQESAKHLFVLQCFPEGLFDTLLLRYRIQSPYFSYMLSCRPPQYLIIGVNETLYGRTYIADMFSGESVDCV